MKRGRPRALLTDNGSAMLAAETTQGLLELGIHHTTTLPYSPHQNGKQEILWAQAEGRLLPMLEGVEDLTLDFLNEATQAWAELEYNRALHSELGCSPLDCFLRERSVGLESPYMWELGNRQVRSTHAAPRRAAATTCLWHPRLSSGPPQGSGRARLPALHAVRWGQPAGFGPGGISVWPAC